MDSKILKFLEKERVGVVSVILPSNISHSASVHLSHQKNPLKLFIQTTNTTEKVKPLLNGEVGKASMVIGFSEKDWITLQMRGEMKIVSNPEDLEKIYKIHYKKHPDAEQYKGPKTVFMEFTPNWWRYTDFNTEPETIIRS